MNLHEYQAREILARHGIPLPGGAVATTPEEARAIAARLGGPVVVKAQVHAGGRGKAGGVKLARDAAEAAAHASRILGMTIKGLTVRQVLVAPAADIASESYVGVIVDRASQRPVLMVSGAGGIDIEEVAARTPDRIHRLAVDPRYGLLPHQALGLALHLYRDVGQARAAADIMRKLYAAVYAVGASLAEINPLATTPDGQVIALDAKVVIDDNELERHPEIAALRDATAEAPSEVAAREAGLTFIKLEGSVGCCVNGAGLAMATMDLVKYYGGEPANFLDIGGSSNPRKVVDALRIITADPTLRAILFNIFGGITRCDDATAPLDGAPRHPAHRHQRGARRPDPHGGRVFRPHRHGRGGEAGRGAGRGMSVFLDQNTRLVVQGITGRDGSFHTRQMISYGTKVVAGVTPGKGGQLFDGVVPIFDTVADAVRETRANTAVIYVPAAAAASAVFEAADAGLGLVVCITEGIPVLDMTRVLPYLHERGARLIGPNCPGLISPGKSKVGIIPGNICQPGRIGVVSRSGTLTYEIVHQLSTQGYGQSTCIGIGGDPLIGTSFIHCLSAFQADAGTDAVVMIGEIGGTDEQQAAEFVTQAMTKPVIGFVAGQTAPPGRRMGHAGAIISGSSGTAAEKMAAFERAGISVMRRPADVVPLLKERL